MSQATLITTGERPVVRLERYLNRSLDQAWHAVTDRQELKTWFPCDVIVERGRWEVGATITFCFPADVIDLTLAGEVLEVDQPNRLALTWGDEVLRLELSRDDELTRIVLFDELSANIAARNAAGWQVCLDRLAGLEPDPKAWQKHFATYSKAFAPILGPQEGPPPGHKAH